MKSKANLILVLLIILSICGVFVQYSPIKANHRLIKVNNNIFQDNSELFPYYDGKLWGYMNQSGAVVINPKYNQASIFTEGLAVIGILDGNKLKMGFTDTKGITVIKPTFVEAHNFVDGYAKVLIEEKDTTIPKTGYIDKKGEVVTPPKSWFLNQTNGLERFQDKNTSRLGYKDINGRTIIPPSYDSAGPFRNGFAPVAKLSQKGLFAHGFINTRGQFVININDDWGYAEYFHEGKALVSDRKLGKVYVNEQGKLAVKDSYWNATGFYEGLAYVIESDSEHTFYHGYFIDAQGKKVFDLGVYKDLSRDMYVTVEYLAEDYISRETQRGFYHGLVPLTVHNYQEYAISKSTYMDKKGNLIYPEGCKLPYKTIEELVLFMEQHN